MVVVVVGSSNVCRLPVICLFVDKPTFNWRHNWPSLTVSIITHTETMNICVSSIRFSHGIECLSCSLGSSGEMFPWEMLRLSRPHHITHTLPSPPPGKAEWVWIWSIPNFLHSFPGAFLYQFATYCLELPLLNDFFLSSIFLSQLLPLYSNHNQ